MHGKIKFLVLLGCLLLSLLSTGCGQNENERVLYVYNWGDYIDPEVIKEFEQETGIKVVYDTFATNEEMYVKVRSGGSDYDVVIPSDYMIKRLARENLLAKIDWQHVPNIKGVDDRFRHLAFDAEGEYTAPYMWGTVGISYNTKMVHEPVDSWGILWNPAYAKEIFMLDSPRDSLGITLKYLGYSLNSGDKAELEQVKAKLIQQKKLVLAYVVDEVKDKMIAGEGALAVVWSGDAAYMMAENPDLAYALPKEGTNLWVDAMVILKNSRHKAEAEEFINFMLRPDIALKNAEYIGYASPMPAVKEELPEEVQEDLASYPGEEYLKNTEVFDDLTENLELYDQTWTEVKVAR